MWAFLLTGVLALQAQTARQFTIDLTEDGKAQMVAFLPEKPSGKAIVGIPGGGYSVLSNTHEGTQWSGWLNERGIAYFVVNYRLPNGDRTIPIGDVEKGFRIVRNKTEAFFLKHVHQLLLLHYYQDKLFFPSVLPQLYRNNFKFLRNLFF